MRWDSPFVLAVAGTLAIHVILLTAGDALVVIHPPRKLVPAPHIELVEVELPPPAVAPLPPPPEPEPEVKPPPPPPRPQVARPRAQPSQIRTAPDPTPPTNTEVPVPSGGDQVVHMDDIAPSATGVAVATGKPSTRRIGRGGTGGGTGAGAGTGSAEGNARPMSVATIKTKAMPRRDYGYLGVGREYPAEAKALGVEGQIRVRLIVNERGTVTSRVLLNKLGHGLDELAMKQAAELEFEPAKDTDDQPVTSVVVWTFTMTLPK